VTRKRTAISEFSMILNHTIHAEINKERLAKTRLNITFAKSYSKKILGIILDKNVHVGTRKCFQKYFDQFLVIDVSRARYMMALGTRNACTLVCTRPKGRESRGLSCGLGGSRACNQQFARIIVNDFL
jgi:hypothetical protein